MLDSLNFYRFIGSVGFAHSDGTNANGTDATVNHFQWFNRPQSNAATPELDNNGFPTISATCQSAQVAPQACTRITNSGNSFTSWFFSAGGTGALHAHWYGMPDAYFLTGDESIREAMWGIKTWFLTAQTAQAGFGGGTNCDGQCFSRYFGIALMGSSRLSAALASYPTPDTDSTNVLAAGTFIFNTWIKPDACVKDGGGTVYPTGCTPPPLTAAASPSDGAFQGISLVRGAHLSARAAGWCPKNFGSNNYRILQTFQHSIMEKGMLELRNIKGSSWSDYNFSLDLAFGTARFALTEIMNDDKSMFWQSPISNGFFNGPRFIATADIANACSVPSNQLDTSGTVTTVASVIGAGTASPVVTWLSGIDFTNVNVNDSI